LIDRSRLALHPTWMKVEGQGGIADYR